MIWTPSKPCCRWPRRPGPTNPKSAARDDVADADMTLIVGKCAWLRHCRDDAAVLPEPEWYAALSILVRCKDGARLAHAWSKDHPKYAPAETDAKLKQALDKAGPRTCESIRADFGTVLRRLRGQGHKPYRVGPGGSSARRVPGERQGHLLPY